MSVALQKSLRNASRTGFLLGAAFLFLAVRDLHAYRTSGTVRIGHTYYLASGTNAIWPLIGEFGAGILLCGFGLYYYFAVRRMRRDPDTPTQQNEIIPSADSEGDGVLTRAAEACQPVEENTDAYSEAAHSKTRLLALVLPLVILFLIVGPFVDRGLVAVVKWPLYGVYAFGVVLFMGFLPDVWQNRKDDKFAIAFVLGVALLFLANMWITLSLTD